MMSIFDLPDEARARLRSLHDMRIIRAHRNSPGFSTLVSQGLAARMATNDANKSDFLISPRGIEAGKTLFRPVKP